MEVNQIEIREELINVLREKFKSVFNLNVQEASDSSFLNKMEYIRARVGVHDITIKENIKPNSIKQKFKRALVFPENSIGGVTIEEYDFICYFFLGKNLLESSMDFSGGKRVRIVNSSYQSKRIGKIRKEGPLKENIDTIQRILEKNVSNEVFDHIDNNYWAKYKNKKSKDELIEYYLRASTLRLLPYVMMFEENENEPFYVTPEDAFLFTDEVSDKKINLSFEDIFLNSNEQKKILVKVLSEGGEGKSTLLLHLAKKYFRQFNFLKCNAHSEISNIQKYLPSFQNQNQVVILLENPMNHKNYLDRYTNAFDIAYGERGFTLLLAERINRYEISDFERYYDKIYQLNYKIAYSNQERFFNKVWNFLSIDNNLIYRENLKNDFLSSPSPLRFKVRQLFISLGITNKVNIREDWEDWKSFINANPEYVSLRRLYSVVAFFNKFGFSVPINFKMLTYPYAGDSSLINEALSKTTSSPFFIESTTNEVMLRLRHDTAADEYFSHEKNQDEGRSFLKEFLANITDKYAASLFRNLQELNEFKNSPLFNNLLNDQNRVSILEKYYQNTIEPEERGKTIIRLSVLLINLGKFDSAIESLNRHLQIDGNNRYAKTLLASIFLRDEYNRVEEAEILLKQVFDQEKTDIYSIEKLLSLYSRKELDISKLDALIVPLPSNTYINKKIAVSIILKLIAQNELISAISRIDMHQDKFNDSNISFFYEKILSKSDTVKRPLIKFLLEENNLVTAELILKSFNNKSHFGYKKCYANLLIAKKEYREVILFLEGEKINNPQNKKEINYLLLQAYELGKYLDKQKDLILELCKSIFYDPIIKNYLNTLIYSNIEFAESQYLNLERLFKKVIIQDNAQEDKIILFEIYTRFVRMRFNYIFANKNLDPLYFSETLKILRKAKLFAKNNSLETLLLNLEKEEKIYILRYKRK